MENNLLVKLNHLDTTSISVEGNYINNRTGECLEQHDDDFEPKIIHITHGHSKDHRSDLKQVVLSLVVNGPSAMPIWMDGLDGNNSDKTSFHETIKKVKAFKKTN